MATKETTEWLAHLRHTVRVHGGGMLTDGQLLDRFIHLHDELAFEVLVRRHGPMVFQVCRRFLGHDHDADDAFQATFVILARKASSIWPREQVGGWLHGVACRTALKARSLRARLRSREQTQAEPECPDPAPDFLQDIRQLLNQEIGRLPDRYKLPVILCELEGRSRKEVALQLGLPEGTLSSRLAAARKMLARRLRNHELILSAAALNVMLGPVEASVPEMLLSETIRSSTSLTAELSVGIRPAVMTLAQGVMKGMIMTKIKIAVIILLTSASLLGGGILCSVPFLSGQDTSVGKVTEKGRRKPPEPIRGDGEKRAEKEEKPAEPTLQDRLKKLDDEIMKLRTAMLEECDKEAKKADEAVKKAQKDLTDAARAADREKIHTAQKALVDSQHRLQAVRMSRTDIEHRIHPRRISGSVVEPPDVRLGLYTSRPGKVLVQQLGLAKDQTLVVDRVSKDSVAAKVGLQSGDILLQVAGKAVPGDQSAFRKMLEEIKPGIPVEVVLLREGKQQTLKGLTIPADKKTAAPSRKEE